MPSKAKANHSNVKPHDDGFVGVVTLDLEKTTELAAEEVSRIGSQLTDTASEILKCQSDQERRACVAKAMRDYETAVKWIQVIVPPSQTELEADNGTSPDSIAALPGAGSRPAESAPRDAGKLPPGSPPASAPPPPTWSAAARVPSLDAGTKAVPPPPNHPPSLPIGRNQPAAHMGNNGFRGDQSGSWSKGSSTASVHTPHDLSQHSRAEAQQASRCNHNFHLDGRGSWSNRSSSTCPDSAHEYQQSQFFDRQPLPLPQNQGPVPMNSPMNMNLMNQQQPLQHPQQHPQQHPHQQHPQQHQMQELQQRLAHMMQSHQNNVQCMSNVQSMACMQNSQPMSGMQSTQPMQNMQNTQGIQSTQPMMAMQNTQPMPGMQNTQPLAGMQNAQNMPGMQNAQNMPGMQNPQALVGMQGTQPMSMQNAQSMQGMAPGNFQVQVIALPLGAPPPQGTILAASAEPPNAALAGTAPAMNEIFPQDLCQVAKGGKFRIIDPKTGEEVQAPSEDDKTSKRLPILNPGTGQEVLPDKENLESGASLEEHQYSSSAPLQEAKSSKIPGDVDAKSVGASWDWPLSRHEIRDRLVHLPK